MSVRITVTLPYDIGGGLEPEDLPDGLGGTFILPEASDDPEQWPFPNALKIAEEALTAYWDAAVQAAVNSLRRELITAGWVGLDYEVAPPGQLMSRARVDVTWDTPQERQELIDGVLGGIEDGFPSLPPGEAPSDWDVIEAVAQRLDEDMADVDDYGDAVLEAGDAAAARAVLWRRAGLPGRPQDLLAALNVTAETLAALPEATRPTPAFLGLLHRAGLTWAEWTAQPVDMATLRTLVALRTSV